MARHGLTEPPSGPVDRAGLLALIEQLGFVQVDSINTVERAHHMILFARRQSYRPRHLTPLLEKDHTLFEHWTHDASVIPTKFYPHWQLRFARHAERLGKMWRKSRREGYEEKFETVLEHIRSHGPALARDMGDGEKRSKGGWWDWHPSKTALEYLWRTGALAVRARDGFQKVFDLTERVVPAELRECVPAPDETIDWACSSALDRLGFATSGEIAAFWETAKPDEARAWCAARVGEELIEVDIESADGSRPRRVFARPDLFDRVADTPEPTKRIRILSPFDPLLRDRKRTERLFGFHYRIEIFVPEPKRRYGYYVFPILEGDRLIGRIDMKCRRNEGVLDVAALWLEPKVRPSKGRLRRLEAELDRISRFAGCELVRFRNGWLREQTG